MLITAEFALDIQISNLPAGTTHWLWSAVLVEYMDVGWVGAVNWGQDS